MSDRTSTIAAALGIGERWTTRTWDEKKELWERMRLNASETTQEMKKLAVLEQHCIGLRRPNSVHLFGAPILERLNSMSRKSFYLYKIAWLGQRSTMIGLSLTEIVIEGMNDLNPRDRSRYLLLFWLVDRRSACRLFAQFLLRPSCGEAVRRSFRAGVPVTAARQTPQHSSPRAYRR